ncbi:X-ray radiation resistance-associated protein 1-like isoform X2 [Acanthaster planci]|uniref:X-ray radiation resistance-associated protein 1-like isoform X2 n=1 Tax=Acanthaster planci TaxID=133434 RepID=A0A8B7Z0V8_ACAPL|nr:X-ray radiation resistance-associated protein 1-like isoform X2 [Acanthaster planci]
MAVPAGVKLDDGSGGFFTNCFPARNIFRQSEDAGAWMVAQRAEQRRHFKAVLCAKPKTYAQLKHERKERDKEEKRKRQPPSSPDVYAEADTTTPGLLDGFFLLKHCCVEDPTDVCSINITGKELTDVKEDDFQLFDNVAYINAGENLLPFEAFSHFPIVREVELPLNALRGIRIDLDDFPCLEVLDLSYNNLSKEDILALGMLPKLKVLYLTGNQLRSLPVELAKPYKVTLADSRATSIPRFPCLELLFLDDNHLTDLATFASLAGLKRLKQLNLDKNDIALVPHLKALSGKHVAVESEPPSAASTPGRKARRKSAKSRGGSRSGSVSPGQTPTESDGQDINHSAKHLSEIKEEPQSSSVHDNDPDQDLPPPFPELEHLSLAFNKISDEESLLAVAAWPMLKELIIHDNPLTTNSSGDPPLLKRYLKDRLGIHMVRRKPDHRPKPPIQVAEVVPPIPKKPLQLMLESGDVTKALPSSLSHPTPLTVDKPQQPISGPLPPIPATPEERPQTYPLHHRESRDEVLEAAKMTRTKSWTAENVPSSQASNDKADEVQQADEPVFLTQVDDQTDEQKPQEAPSDQEPDKDPKKEKPKKLERVDSAAYSMSVPDKFKGYEIFYDTPDDPDEEPVVTDIQGNLRSLRLALKHPTLYQNQVDLEKLQKPFEPYQRRKFQPRPPHKSKAEKLEDILETMKNRLVIEEVNLGKLLQDQKMLKKDYPEALQLLQEIQAKYSTVRASSMHTNQNQQEAVTETLQAMQDLSDRLKLQNSSHGGARPKSGSTTRVRSKHSSAVN